MIPKTECYQKEFEMSNKKCFVSFDKEDQSTEGGLILISKLENGQGIINKISKTIEDWRYKDFVIHKIEEMLRQRIFGIIQGYEDCNDHAYLRKDPLMLLVNGRKMDEPLASQPTLTRLENHIDGQTIERMHVLLIDEYVKSLPHKTRSVRLDIDGSFENTYGQQVFSFYNGYFKHKAYYPLFVFHYPTGRLVGVKLRKGNSSAFDGGSELLEKIIRKIKVRFPKCRIKVVGDAGFGVPEIMDKLEDLNKELKKIDYTLGIAGNAVLQKMASQHLFNTVIKWNAMGRPTEHYKEYHSIKYKAADWKQQRQIIYKTEMGPEGHNLRFIVTNMKISPKAGYEDYSLRGQSENWIGEFKNAMNGDRLSCHEWTANEFRSLLHAFAYNLMNDLRLLNDGTEYSVMRLFNLRLKLLKVSVWIKQTVRAIHLRLPKNYPNKKRWVALLAILT
jgi:hypothetical protein